MSAPVSLFKDDVVLTAEANVIVRRAKLHNDSSCDISQDGQLLCTFIQTSRSFNGDITLGVFALQPRNRGQCLYTKTFGNTAGTFCAIRHSPSDSLSSVNLCWFISSYLFFFFLPSTS